VRYRSLLPAMILVLIFATIGSIAADEILYGRYPALSPDGQTIAFTYMGDIWTVPSTGGEAARLTVHDAEDIRPQFSPDGKWILFSSRRFDNYDLFIIPVEGGTPRQLTVNSADDFGTGWFPQSDSVVFTSFRGRYRDIYKVGIDGGTPILMTGYLFDHEYNGRITSDGRYLLYANGSGMSRWWRRDLKASKIADIYLCDREQKTFTSKRLTNNPTHDIWPVLNEARNELYFVSYRGDWAQVWKQSLDGGEAVALTNFTGDGVQWLNSNPQGTMLVFEQGFKIWMLDPDNGTPQEIPITIRSDERFNLDEKKTFKGDVQWYSLSPDEKKIAAVIHGEIYVLPVEDAVAGKQITYTSARERRPVWADDSRTIYYCSDRDGDYDLYKADVVTGLETQLTFSDVNDIKPLVSPDGKYVVFMRGLDTIMRLDIASGKAVEWVSGMFFDMGLEPWLEYDWSPDSKWLAFTMCGPTYESDVYIASLDGAVRNVSKFSEWNYRPRFSQDGKLLYFSSTAYDRDETFKIDLKHKPFEFYEAAFDSLFMDEAKDDEGKKADKVDGEEIIPEVVIDFDNIDQRKERAYALSAASTNPVLTPDGEKYVFTSSLLGKNEIWSVNVGDDPELTQITSSGKGKSLLSVTDDAEYVLYLEDGKIKKTEIDGGKTEPISFEAVLDINKPALNRQKFNEAWQALNTYFYDSDFHGADWNQVHEKYRPVVANVRGDLEFRDVIKEMLGELRASHLDIYSSDPRPDATVKTAYIGVEPDYTVLERDGAFKIARVLPESPAALAGLEPGEYIQAINDRLITQSANVNALLAGMEGKRLILTVSEKRDGKGRRVDIKPISQPAWFDLVYDDWVATRRHMVDSLSGGRLAYLHIRAMSGPELELFKQRLVSLAESKDGVIIDVRNNGGGNIAVHLLGIMIKTPYFLRSFRDFPVTSENKLRSKAVEKPMALLINGFSASNSEIFAEGFRTLKLGKIIGEPTAGAVIGTGSYTLIDGTRIRRPSWGAFTAEMEDTDKSPRYPDILVENLTDDYINGRDPQLVRAVEELLKELPQ